MLADLINLTTDTFFPSFCAGCGQPFTVMCDRCYNKLDFLFGEIQTNLQPTYLDKLQASVHFKGPIKSLIKEMKYLSAKTNAHWAGLLLQQTVEYPQVDIVTGVPLHLQRRRERGFNQAEEIGRVFALQANFTYRQLLKRQINTPHQASFKSRHRRLKALNKVFKLADEIDALEIKGKSILVIDDVVTTGTTLNQCAKVLKENGAKAVYGLAVAHD